jgi:predicted nucleic acid-binding protein
VGKVILDTNLWIFFLVGHDYDCKEIDFLQDAEIAPLFFESFKGEKEENIWRICEKIVPLPRRFRVWLVFSSQH